MHKMMMLPVAALFGMGSALLATNEASAQPINPGPLLQNILTDQMKSDSVQQGSANVIKVQRRRNRNRRGRRYRRNNGAGVAAGIAGAIIGGAIIANERSRYRDRRYRRRHHRARRGNRHVNWCFDRYRSYRAYDNTYQPYSGGRRRCNSPYH